LIHLLKVLLLVQLQLLVLSIVVSLAGPMFPNLTLIDLPGLIRATSSNESKALIPKVKAMVLRFLEQQRTIILAVVPANIDYHNTEILQLAQVTC